MGSLQKESKKYIYSNPVFKFGKLTKEKTKLSNKVELNLEISQM